MIRRLVEHIWQLVKSEEAFTLPLYFAWVTTTFGMAILGILLWASTAAIAYRDLRSAAQVVANAGEAQVTQSTTAVNSGYVSIVWSMNPTQVQNAANSMWQTLLSNTRLNTEFTNLNMSVLVQGNVVTISVSGSYAPLFIHGLSQKLPNVVPSVTIPMRVLITDEYPVLGQ